MHDDIELVGMGIPWEDNPVGRRVRTIGRTITETDIVNFVCTTGMLEVLFTNIEFLKSQSVLKGRIVPAPLVYCIGEGLLAQAIGQGVGLAMLKLEIDVKGPTFANDTVSVISEVVECRPSRSKPGVAIAKTVNTIVKQDGSTVLVYTKTRLVKGRDYKPAQADSSQ